MNKPNFESAAIRAMADQVNSVSCVLHALLWAAGKCEDTHDFEQFHSLVLELVPRMGIALDRGVQKLGVAHTGLFIVEETFHD